MSVVREGRVVSIVWENPGPAPLAFGQVLDQLDEHPGRWALISENYYAEDAERLQKRYPLYEFTTRGQNNGRVAKLYARRLVEEEP